jgi:hypothetical protein
MDQIRSPAPARAFRHDGWTASRQLTFLATLARTRSVTAAARAAGMSRESAYRLRKRDPDGLFAAAWDRALKGHKAVASRAARSRRKRPSLGRIWPMRTEGHEVHDPLFSRIGPPIP